MRSQIYLRVRFREAPRENGCVPALEKSVWGPRTTSKCLTGGFWGMSNAEDARVEGFAQRTNQSKQELAGMGSEGVSEFGSRVEDTAHTPNSGYLILGGRDNRGLAAATVFGSPCATFGSFGIGGLFEIPGMAWGLGPSAARGLRPNAVGGVVCVCVGGTGISSIDLRGDPSTRGTSGRVLVMGCLNTGYV
jgi:hypothetical protein